MAGIGVSLLWLFLFCCCFAAFPRESHSHWTAWAAKSPRETLAYFLVKETENSLSTLVTEEKLWTEESWRRESPSFAYESTKTLPVLKSMHACTDPDLDHHSKN